MYIKPTTTYSHGVSQKTAFQTHYAPSYLPQHVTTRNTHIPPTTIPDNLSTQTQSSKLLALRLWSRHIFVADRSGFFFSAGKTTERINLKQIKCCVKHRGFALTMYAVSAKLKLAKLTKIELTLRATLFYFHFILYIFNTLKFLMSISH